MNTIQLRPAGNGLIRTTLVIVLFVAMAYLSI